MSRNKLLSRDWCNLIFEGRNQDYGAYRLRAGAGRRYAVAMGVVVGFFLFWVVLFVSVGLYVSYKLKNVQVDVTAFSRLKRLEAEEGHEMKSLAAGRSLVARQAMTPGATMSAPEIVKNMPPPSPVGHNGPVELSEEEARELALLENPTDLTDNPDDSLVGPHLTPTDVVEEMPQFPGGLAELMKWLDRNVVYPQQSIRQRLEGRVEVSFIVDRDGTVRDPRVTRKLDPILDKACLMAVQRMPKWHPGRVGGRVSQVMIVLPVDFRLE